MRICRFPPLVAIVGLVGLVIAGIVLLSSLVDRTAPRRIEMTAAVENHLQPQDYHLVDLRPRSDPTAYTDEYSADIPEPYFANPWREWPTDSGPALGRLTYAVSSTWSTIGYRTFLEKRSYVHRVGLSGSPKDPPEPSEVSVMAGCWQLRRVFAFKKYDYAGRSIMGCVHRSGLFLYKMGFKRMMQQFAVSIGQESSPVVFRSFSIHDEVDCANFVRDAERLGPAQHWLVKGDGINAGGGQQVYFVRAPEIISALRAGGHVHNYNGKIEIGIAKCGANKPVIYHDKPQCLFIERFLMKPLVLDGRRADLRVYYVMTGGFPILGFLAGGIMNLALVPFDESRFDNPFVFNTNTHVQDKLGNFSEAMAQWHLDQVEAYMLKSGMMASTADYAMRFMEPIRRAVVTHLLAAREQIDRFRGSFQLFGCDLMIDEGYSVFVSECNTAPGMPESTLELPHKLARTINMQEEMLGLVFELDNMAGASLRRMKLHTFRSLQKFELLFNEADMESYLGCVRVGWRDLSASPDLSCPAGFRLPALLPEDDAAVLKCITARDSAVVGWSLARRVVRRPGAGADVDGMSRVASDGGNNPGRRVARPSPCYVPESPCMNGAEAEPSINAEHASVSMCNKNAMLHICVRADERHSAPVPSDARRPAQIYLEARWPTQ